MVPGDTRTNTDIFVRDRKAGTVTRVSVSTTGAEAKGESGSDEEKAPKKSRSTKAAKAGKEGEKTKAEPK